MITLYVEKDTDLMRSTFMAFGLSALFQRLAGSGRGIDITLRDLGSVYTVEVPLTLEFLLVAVRQQGRLPEILPAILKAPTEKEQKAEGAERERLRQKYKPDSFTGVVIDYEAERQKLEPIKGQKKGERQEGAAPQRPLWFPLVRNLVSYFGSNAMKIGYPLLLHTWHRHQGENAEWLLLLILERYASFPNEIDKTEETWLTEFLPYLSYTEADPFDWKNELRNGISGQAVVSPSTVQGYHTTTAAKGINNEPAKVFWLDLYLTFAGYMIVGLPYVRIAGDSGKEADVILYYPLPKEIRFEHASAVIEKYRKTDSAQWLYDYSSNLPRAKIDVLCHILFYTSVIRHYRENYVELDMIGKIDAIHGLAGYYYKYLTAQTPFDETAFIFPAWLPLGASLEKLEVALEILEQHEKIIRSVETKEQGKHKFFADELIILNHYRRYITLGDPDDWIAFTIAYTHYHFTKVADDRWRPALSLDVFKESIMSYHTDRKDYRPILENAGFQRVANAIRECTVKLRYFKDVKEQQIAFKVRHGLGDDLRRRSHNPDQFIEDLSAFIYDYTRESSSVEADWGETRPFVTQDDLHEVTGLVAEYGSRVVANLLVAAGYSSSYSSKS